MVGHVDWWISILSMVGVCVVSSFGGGIFDFCYSWIRGRGGGTVWGYMIEKICYAKKIRRCMSIEVFLCESFEVCSCWYIVGI